MKILWLSHVIPYPPKGGVLQRSYNILRETARRHDVHLLAFVQNALVRRAFPDIDTGRREAHRALMEFCEDVRFVDIPSESRRWGKQRLALRSFFTSSPYTINWLRSKKMEEEVAAAVARHPFDVVHFDTISLAPYLRLVAHTRTALDHHNIESSMMLRRAAMEKSWAKKLYYWQEGLKLRAYERAVCQRFDVHLTCSALDSTRLAEIDSSLAVEEIPNGADIDYFRPSNGQEVPGRLVFAGGLNWYPNRDAMLYFAKEVWPVLKRRRPEVTMDVIGPNPPIELDAIAKKDDSFRVHGFVDDVRPYIDRAAIYVCPIRDGGGTKLKMLDAFAMAKATVAHPVACEGIDVTPGHDVLLASSVDEYVKAIELLLADADRRLQLGANARILIEQRYAYSSIGEKLSRIYESLPINSSPRPVRRGALSKATGEQPV